MKATDSRPRRSQSRPGNRGSYLPDIHRSLPQSLDSEKGVLCSALLSPVNVLSECIERLEINHFYHPAHQIIYREMIVLQNAAKPVDFITLTQVLKDKGELDKAGGAAAISELFTFVPTASNADYYIDIVREKFLLRQLIQTCTEFAGRAYDEQGEVKVLLGEVEDKFRGLGTGAGDGDILSDLDSRRFDPLAKIEQPVAVWRANSQSIGTEGNLVTISAQVKSGKTGFTGALIGSTFEGPGDCFGLDSENPEGRALVHFDTEQSRYDFHRCAVRSVMRADVATAPPWYRAYSLADIPTSKRREALRAEIRRASAAHNGVLAVLLDGVADFVADPNDPEECFAFVDELHQLAITYMTVIVCVLHENPGSENGKTRGHLGSQLERKSETNLRLVKDASGVSTVYSEKSRNCHIPRERGIRFMWSDEHGRHVSAPDFDSSRADEMREECSGILDEVFREVTSTGYSWAELHRRVAETLGLTPNGVRKRVGKMISAGFIRKTPGGFFHKNP